MPVANRLICVDTSRLHVSLATDSRQWGISASPTPIQPLHPDTFSATPSADCHNPTYQWYKNGTAIAGATNAVCIASLFNADHISVIVHCKGTCIYPDTAVSNSLTTVNVKNVENVNNLIVWPNPANSILNIQAHVRIETIELFNMLGQCMLSQTAASENASVNIKGLPAGIYLLRLNKQYTQRVRIE